MIKSTAGVMSLALAVSVAGAGDVAFVKKLIALRDGDTVTVSFTVSAATDVEVAILDAKGHVVRHLAAGVLGENPPAPLKPGLKQVLAWDGKDDDGKTVDVGSCRVRVSLGLNPQFDSYLLYDPDATPAVHSLGVGPKGRIYAFYKDPTANGNQGGLKIKILDRDGKHLRHLMPFSAALPFDRVKATGAFQDEAGNTVPRVWNWHTLNFYPDPQIARYRSMSALSLPAVDANGRVCWIVSGARLAALDADGGVPYDTFISEPLTAAWKGAGAVVPSLAASGDGKWLYLAGLGHSTMRDPKMRSRSIYTGFPCVLRISTATRTAEVFLGKPEEAGTKGTLLTAPRGLAVADGLLYVADPGAGRIAVFKEADGSPVGEVRVASPQTVDVDPKTGAIYTCVYTGAQTADLVKFDGFRAGKELYRVSLPKTGYSPNLGTIRVVGGFSGEQARLWVPGIPYGRGFRRLGYYEDTGTAFEAHDLSGIKGPWADGARDLYIDRPRDELYVKVQGERWYRMDERTGKVKDSFQFKPWNMRMSNKGSELRVDSAGRLITYSWKNGLLRWTRDGGPIPWEGRKKAEPGPFGGQMTFQLNYLALHRDELYLVHPSGCVNVYGMDSKPKRTLIWQCTKGPIPRLDAEGNLYLAMRVKPPGRDYPAFFDDRLGKAPDYFRNIGEKQYWYCYMYGSIVKFPPTGGAAWYSKDLPKAVVGKPSPNLLAAPKRKIMFFSRGRYPHKAAEMQGAAWMRFGFSPYSQTYPAGTPTCMCEGAGFDVDPYGRVFYPNLCQFRVEVIDTENNPITTFGRYGNQDDPAKTLPMAWPTYVTVSDTHAYVNDTINLRVTRVRLDHAVEEVVEIE